VNKIQAFTLKYCATLGQNNSEFTFIEENNKVLKDLRVKTNTLLASYGGEQELLYMSLYLG